MKNAIKEESNYRVDTVSQFYDLNSCRRVPNFRANGTAMDWIHYEAGEPDTKKIQTDVHTF